MKPLVTAFLIMTMLGLFFALDGYVALGATTTGGCTTGICTTTVISGSTLTTQVTSSVTTYVTTVSGSVTTTTTTYNPSNVQFTITSNPSPAIAGQMVTLTATAQVPLPGATYSWFFGDGTSSVGGSSVSHIYASPLTYPVVVLVQQTNAGGSPVNIGSGNIGLPVSCPTTGCIAGTPAVLVVTVTSSYTGSGLAGASAALINSAGTTVYTQTTNQAGQATFSGAWLLPSTTYTVTVSASNYNSASQQVTMPSSGGTSLSFNLLYATGCVGACPQGIAGPLFGGNPYFELEAGIALAAVSGVGAALSEREEEHE